MKRILVMVAMIFSAAFSCARLATETEVRQVVSAQLDSHTLFAGRTIREVSQVSFGAAGYLWQVALTDGGYFLVAASTKELAVVSFGLRDFVMPEIGSIPYQHLAHLAQQGLAKEADEGAADDVSWLQDSASLCSATDIKEPMYWHADKDCVSWNQLEPYNALCPNSAPTGCVATAGAQFMKTLKWPVYVEQTASAELLFKGNAGNVTVKYEVPGGTRFQYDTLPKIPATHSTDRATCEIAQLMLYNDILSKMQFAGGVSVTSFGPLMGSNLFGPKSVMRYDLYQSGYTKAAGEALLAAAQEGLPVLISLQKPTHAVLGGGYAELNGVVYIHLNYGYNGVNDGWYAVDNNMFIYIAYPKRTVQCDPLPKIISRTPTLSWHLPMCYADNLSGFTLFVHSNSTAGVTWRDDLSQQLGTIVETTEFELDSEARSYTFAEPLMPGKQYTFSVRPNFKDGAAGITSALQTATVASAGVGAEPERVEMYFSSPAAADVEEAKIETTNAYRICYLNGQSVIRVETSPLIQTLTCHSSHPTEYPNTMFQVKSHGMGVFDILIDGTKAKKQVNDTIMLTVTGTTAKQSTYSQPVMLTFNTNESQADSKAIPEYKHSRCWDIPDGENWVSMPVSAHWIKKHQLPEENLDPHDDPDGDGLSNLTEYLLGTNPNDSSVKDEPLQITSLTVNADGSVSITYTPENAATGISDFILQGKKELSSEWETHDAADTTHRFFRVRVTPRVTN